MNSVVAYRSDDVLRTFARFRTASTTDPSTLILMRLVSDFILAIRRDLNGGQSAATGVELIGMRVNDLYNQEGLYNALTAPFENVCAKNEWVPPWEGMGTKVRNSEAEPSADHAQVQ